MSSATCSESTMRAIERAVRLLTALDSIMHISRMSFSDLIIVSIERRTGLPEACTDISEATCVLENHALCH
jgi:hypothetical protein